MRAFATDFFASSPMLLLPVIALLIFFAIFLGACVVAYRLPAAEASRRAHIPLTNEDRRD